MAILRYEYPLRYGGSEYSFGTFVWAVALGLSGEWEITAEEWEVGLDVPPRVIVTGFADAGTAVEVLVANSPPLYRLTGAPLPSGPQQGFFMDSLTTDRELVLDFQPTARVECRQSPRTGRPQCRVVCLPDVGERADLGPWCGTQDRAWEAACLRQGLRLDHRA